MAKPAVVGARWRLRIHAEGARGLKAASGMMSLDAKPDPYAIFVFNGVTKHIEPVQDVAPIDYFTWPDAIIEFEVPEETIFLQAALVVHVKDKDILKDRYIGGTSIPLAPMYTGQTHGMLCQSKFFVLEFEDEKLKKKKASGEIKLTMTVIDSMKKAAPEPQRTASKNDAPQEKDVTPQAIEPPPSSASSQTVPTQRKTSGAPPGTAMAVTASEAEKKPTETPVTPSVDEAVALPRRTSKPPTEALDPPRRPSRSSAATEPTVEVESKSDSTSQEQAASTGGQTNTSSTSLVNIRALKIELLTGHNLTRPTSVGALFDRKPDPMVTIELYGLSKTSVALKDVDLKKPVEWTDTFLVFDLPHSPPPTSKRKGYGPLDLVVHVKDENLMKATYMGGGKVDISDLFEERSEATGWCWQASASYTETAQERIVALTHSDEKLSKKKACGEIVLRFHFVPEPVDVPSIEEPSPVTTSPIVVETPSESVTPNSDDNQAKAQDKPPVAAEVLPVLNPVHHSDIKMLSVELLSGRGLSKPRVGNLAKSMLKSMFDRKPDPYAVMILGTQMRRCPTVNDVDVTSFEWINAVQVFEFSSKPYPDTLVIHIRDEDVAGSDPYMGGCCVLMRGIWDEAYACATSDPPGDPQIVKSYSLTFTDEKMTKQKDCGSLTVRFRWIYSDVELPVGVAEPTATPTTSAADVVQPLKPLPSLKPRTGFVYLRKMALYSSKDVLDSSLDLYVEISSPLIHDTHCSKKGSTETSTHSTKSSVLTDAMKGTGNSGAEKVEWAGDELIIPVCVSLGTDKPDDVEIRIDLKDKNAIMQDVDIATKRLRLKDHATDFTNSQPFTMTIDLDPRGNQLKATKKAPKFEAEIQFLPHDSPLLVATSPEHQGGVVTLFLLRSLLSPPPTKESSLTDTAISLEIDCLATKKTGLMAFGKSSTSEFRSPSLTGGELFENGRCLLEWWSTCSFAVSNKQAVTAKEKESFAIEVGARMKSGKSDKIIGSLQFNIYSAAFTQSSAICSETIQFGALGSMTLEFAAAFHTVADKGLNGGTKPSSKPVVPPVPSGYLHLLVLQAKNLVSPDPKDEISEDLDPEVRVSIEPKYIKRKDNPVRSMLKTKPLENAGAVPTWNEYLRLEYQLPPAELPQPGSTPDQRRAAEAANAVRYPPPVVQIGIFDIQMPGEKNGVQAVGKTELPLSAFLLVTGNALDGAPQSMQLSLDVFLAGKKTGILYLEGIFEPAPSEFKAPADDPAELYRQQCRTIGRELRERSKKLKSGEMDMTTASLLSGNARKRVVPGRLEVHFIGFRCGQGNLASEDRGLSAHLWISSNVDDRQEVKSKLHATEKFEGECQMVWDAQMTFYTSDITTEMLRSEVLTLTGKPVGSLKLPLGGLLQQEHGGKRQREWHALVDSMSSSKKSSSVPASKSGIKHEVLIELAFFADQVVFDPLFVSTMISTDASTVVAINCGKVIIFDADVLGTAEVGCKCTLIGNVPSVASNSAAQVPTERTSFKACENTIGMDGKNLAISRWSEQVKLDVGGSAYAFITSSFANGAQPALRFELLTKRQGARFQDTVATLTLSLVSLLQYPGRKVSRWFKMFVQGAKDGKDGKLCALVDAEIAIFCSGAPVFSALKEEKLLRHAFEDIPQLIAVPGVLCLRFLAGRNLIDVDVNGEQDPYIIAKIIPQSFFSGTLSSAIQTGVAIDGGRHPTWNTSIFELRTQDLLTDYIRVEVIDSNEEDHLPDAYIGAIDIALVSLFREHMVAAKEDVTTVWQTLKTRWLEAWIPIYPVTSSSVENRDDGNNAGEIRMEFRFLTDEYYESVRRQRTDSSGVSSPFSSDLVTVRGTLCLHIVQAFDLPCTAGVQPGVRIASHETFVTKSGKKSIVDPVWGDEVMELLWPPQTSSEGTNVPSVIKVEIVDLAVRTANVNALAVIAFGHLDISSFLSHHLARSYHVYALHGRNPPRGNERPPSILLGCQFVPEGTGKEDITVFQTPEKREEKKTGNLHVKCTHLRLDVSSYLNSIPLDASMMIRVRCCASKGSSAVDDIKAVEVPTMSLAELVQKNGYIELNGDKTALLFKFVGKPISSDSVLVPNPILVGELLTKRKGEDPNLVAEFEIPVFDYVLFDGYLGSAWYPLIPSKDTSSLSPKIGEVRVEIQFLPILIAPPPSIQSKSESVQEAIGISLVGIEIKHVTGWTNTKCCVVVVELLGCTVETKPNVPDTTQTVPSTLCWNEVLDLALPKEVVKTTLDSAIMKFEVRDANDSKFVYGTCNWVVPSDFVLSDGSPTTDSTDIVVPIQLPVGLDKSSKGKSMTAGLPELTFQFVRMSNALPSSSGSDRRRSGLFYLQLEAEDNSDLQKAKGALISSIQVEKASSSYEGPWTELTASERRVVPVYADTNVDTQSLIIVSNDTMVALDGKVLSSIAKAPATDTFHRMTNRLSTGASKDAIPRIACRLMFLEAMQGQLQLQLGSINWQCGPEGKLPGTFQLELRLLSGTSQRWVSSPLGLWIRKTSAITWHSGKNDVIVSYTNSDENVEPALQMVLVQVTNNDNPKKEAYGQITVLSTIAAGVSGENGWVPGTVSLTPINTNTNKGPIQLALRLRFVRELFSFEELEAKLAVERERKALELAEGTATLKKAFVVMGGDESTPISIAEFMKHVKDAAKKSAGNTDDGAVRALEVLQQAADVETGGDLDKLFALMDNNGDGQISWDEYVEHMQNIHALADAAATQSILKQAEAMRETPSEQTTTESHQSNAVALDADLTQSDNELDEDSDLDDVHVTDIPAKPMPSSSVASGIQDVYKVSPPSGESTKEGRAPSRKTSIEQTRPSEALNIVSNTTDPTTSGGERIAPTRSLRSSIRTPNTGPQRLHQEERQQRREEPFKKKLPMLSTNVLDWKVDEVIQWMEHEMELSQYTPAIQQNAINGKLLLTLHEEELESELGVTAVLHKRKIMNQIREFQERFQYPPPDPLPIGKKRGTSARKPILTTLETPAFIKREQLVFQEKQRVRHAESENANGPKTLGQSRVFPTKTKLIKEETTTIKSPAPATLNATESNNKLDGGETFDDAMQDIFEVIHPDSPEKATTSASNSNRQITRFPMIQIGSETNTDELFEVVRQRIHQLSQILLPMANECKETWSDFGDDPEDEDEDHSEPPSEELTGLHLVYDTFRTFRPSASTERISRLKFQEGLIDLLSIEVSWHQFDLLFRRLDVDGDSELCWDEFHHVFTRNHISFDREDLFLLQDALVDFAMARLDSQQWTLSDLFKAFDRDGGGSVSIAEFATLVRFLFTSLTQVKRFQQQTKHKITKRHVYLLMSCLDVSTDRRISHQEFLRFFFIVWSSKLMEVQDQLMALETSHSLDNHEEMVSSLRQAKRTLRRALRTNFSRPFRDAMRCLDVSVPGPFSGLLTRLQLTHVDTQDTIDQSHGVSHDNSLQVWQVLRGQTSHGPGDPHSSSRLRAAWEQKAHEASRLRVQKGRNEVQRTRLTRQREPTRTDAVLQTPSHHVALDTKAMLKFDYRPVK